MECPHKQTTRVFTAHLPRMDLTLAYKAFPCAVLPPTAQKPLMPSSMRAFLVASHHFFSALCANRFLLPAERALLTILPDLLLVKVALVNPPTVFAFLPENTASLARLPFAMTLTFLTFIAFIAFGAFMAFIPAFFIATAMMGEHAGSSRPM